MTTDQPQSTSPDPSLELNLQDLQNLRSVIDLAARRGAFAAKEFVSVGTVYNKLNVFLNAVNPAIKDFTSTE